MNSTLKPHLLVEIMALQERPVPPQKLSTLFLAYRDFPEAFALAFRYRCDVSKPYSRSYFYKPAILVTTKGGMTFMFDDKLFHIPILLRIAGRLTHRIDGLNTEESWSEPFLEGIDENQHLELINCKVPTSFLQRYLWHHDSLPTVQFGCFFNSFAVLDELEDPQIDTVVFNSRSEGRNDKPCRIANVTVGQYIRGDCDPLNSSGHNLKLDIKFLQTLTVNGEIPLCVALRMIKNRYKNVQKLHLGQVRLPVPVDWFSIQDAVERINVGVDTLWNCMLGHSGAVTVGAFFDRMFKTGGQAVFNSCQTAFPCATIVRDVDCVECKFQKAEGNKKLDVRVTIIC
uniref:ORF24 n=1 Tax=Panagrellus redivivus TaxID=6233 RepID=A0A7E4ZWB7_PANRE